MAWHRDDRLWRGADRLEGLRGHRPGVTSYWLVEPCPCFALLFFRVIADSHGARSPRWARITDGQPTRLRIAHVTDFDCWGRTCRSYHGYRTCAIWGQRSHRRAQSPSYGDLEGPGGMEPNARTAGSDGLHTSFSRSGVEGAWSFLARRP